MFEICDYVHADGTVCNGLYDPNVVPPVPCIRPEEEVTRCIEAIANLTPVSV